MVGMLSILGEAFDEVDTYREARPSATYLEHLLGNETFNGLAQALFSKFGKSEDVLHFDIEVQDSQCGVDKVAV